MIDTAAAIGYLAEYTDDEVAARLAAVLQEEAGEDDHEFPEEPNNG